MKKLLTLLSLAIAYFAQAQTPCDSLDIEVQYAPFNDSFIQVHVINHSSAFFGYPQFTLFDSNGDTVAKEDLNFFGIAQESWHTLGVYPGMPSGNTFSGSLELYYMTVDSYAVCTWNMNFNLCPDTCRYFYVTLGNNGSALALGDAYWEILDANSQQVADGMFTLDTTIQYTTDSVCLGPGDYTLKVHDLSFTQGGQKYVGITDYTFSNNPQTSFNDTVATLPFTLFEHCFTPVSVKNTGKKTGQIQMHSYDNTVLIRSTTGAPIGHIAVYSIDGRAILSETCTAAQQVIDLSALPPNMYIIRVVNKTGTYTHKAITGN